jgi:hypothetical protein
LAAQDLELVAQHQQLDVFHMQAPTATNKRAEQRPYGEVEKRESHAADPPSPRRREGDTNIGALQGKGEGEPGSPSFG